MKKKRYYYKFWIKSSRGTDEMTVRVYDKPQKKEFLKGDCEDWCSSSFGAWSVSENVVSYGWTRILKLPKNRHKCLIEHARAWKHRNNWTEKTQLYTALLRHPPFNGQK